MALGLTQQLPIDERHTYNKEYLLNNIAVLMGGRAAEELILHHKTTGAGNDIERATEIARKMVCEWGMSEKLGPLTFGKKEEHIFLGKEMTQRRDFSEQTAMDIDSEIKEIVSGNYARATGLLVARTDALHRIANALLVKEVLDAVEIDKLIAGEDIGEPTQIKATPDASVWTTATVKPASVPDVVHPDAPPFGVPAK